MPEVLNIKPEDVNDAEKRSKYTVSVIGCGHRGIWLSIGFAEAGFKVACSDADLSVIKKVAKAKVPFAGQEAEVKLRGLINSGKLNVTSELKKMVSQSDITIITAGAKVDDQKKIDYTDAVNACKQVASALHSGMLVIYCNIAGFGFNEGTLKETIENTSGLKIGQGVDLAYIPMQNPKQVVTTELKVAPIGKSNIDSITNILKTITKKVKQINDVKTAEIATLFTIAKQDANTALANELAVFCESACIDYFQVLKFLDFNDESFLPTTIDQENKNGAYLLLDSADNISVKLRLPALARQINEEMVRHAVNLTQDALRNCNKTLRRARVAILGTINQTTGVLVKMLQLKGAKPSIYDPLSKKDAFDLGVAKTNFNEAVEGADCIIIVSAEDQFKNLNLKKLKTLAKTPSVLVDLAGVLEPKKVEIEGFIYRGLGRGTEHH
ncbi:MAG TPA: UDP binding domain-containing protein [Candidatus Acidoferrum sp.]|nr:UDP binding domain-containing protein [Candidatus Acidoferrum sp.]